MRIIELGSAPLLEPRAAIEGSQFSEKAEAECREYIALLRRTFGDEPLGAILRLHLHREPLVEYLTVVCVTNDACPSAIQYSEQCRIKGPLTWDDSARRALCQLPIETGYSVPASSKLTFDREGVSI